MERLISLRHMRCFLAVAETQSFTIAASRMFLAQSSLTATIQQFEEAAGVKLFERTTRQVELTEAGRHFKGVAEKVVNEFDTAIRDLKAFDQEGRAHIRVAATSSIVQTLLVPAIPLLRESFPDVTFTIQDSSAMHIEKMLVDGEFDFALVSRHKDYEELEYIPLLHDRYGVVCLPPFPLSADAAPIKWCDLPMEGYVQFTKNTAMGALLSEHPCASRLYEKQLDQVSSSISLYAMLGLRDRYSIVGALAANAEPEFHYRELIEPSLTREICLVTRRLRYMTSDAKRILDALLESFGRMTLPRGATLLHRPAAPRDANEKNARIASKQR